MRSAVALAEVPIGTPLLSDDVVEFHAARILLLLHKCGIKNKVEGLTKLVKLDFFVRYPIMFYHLKLAEDYKVKRDLEEISIESPMIRYHYGPWDPRYYHILAYLESRSLITVEKTGARTFTFRLTTLGVEHAAILAKDAAFNDLIKHMAAVKKVLGAMSGEKLKKLIYESFEEEVSLLSKGDIIK